MLAHGDGSHLLRPDNQSFDRATDELGDGRCRGEREGAQADSLRDIGIAHSGCRVGDAMPLEKSNLGHLGGRSEPAPASTTAADSYLPAVTGHGGHEAADAVSLKP